jgi:enamine deaminase RidA (YjgF/YER057c/UK114 family)
MAKGITYANPEGCGPPQGLYTHVARVSAGDLLFIAGQLAVDASGNRVGKHDFRAQFKQVYSNLSDVLKGMGCSYADIVKFTTYMVHSQDIELFMEERATLFPTLYPDGRCPPNTLLLVDRLVHEDFVIEVEAVARARD